VSGGTVYVGDGENVYALKTIASLRFARMVVVCSIRMMMGR
jgi:hypothetical protein